MKRNSLKITSIVQLYDILPVQERLIVDVLRQLVTQTLPPDCNEKIAYNVPFFYKKRGICIIWPAAVPGGGIKNGVLLGFWHGNRLKDSDRYLTRGNNKRIFYKSYTTVNEIDADAIVKLLNEAVQQDCLP